MEFQNDWQIITLSGRTLGELREAVEYCELIVGYSDDNALQELSSHVNKNNKHYYYRLAFVANKVEELYKLLKQQLFSFDDGRYIYQNEKDFATKLVAFLFSGGGVQYAGMGKNLYETEAVFRKAINHYDEILKAFLPVSLLDILYPAQLSSSTIDMIAYTQPAVFAFELALYKLWKYRGVKPDVVMGHSLGEYAAACVAGVFSEEDGLKLTTERGRLMQELSADALMVAVFADLAKVREVISEHLDKVSIAAENGPVNTVISGATPYVRAACKSLERFGIDMHQLNIARAGHSMEMAPMIEDFRKVLQTVQMMPPKIKLVSNLTGQLITEQIATVEYWCRHTLDMVQFNSSMKTLSQLGIGCFIEVGPQSVLLSMGQKCLENQTEKILWLPSLRDKDDTIQQIFECLAKLYAANFIINCP